MSFNSKRNKVLCNSNDAFVPELWAQESLMVLEESLVMVPLVHRDFSDQIANFGDVVNTRRPGKFTMGRKVDGDSVTKQSAESVNVQVPLDQHGYTSFMIYDGEASKSFKELVSLYLVPAVKSIAKGVDETLLAQKYQFLGNAVGKLGTAITRPTIIDAQVKLDTLMAPQDDRTCVITPAQKGALLSVDNFVNASFIGDSGTALRAGSIGQLHGIDWVQSQNNRTITATTKKTGAVNLSAGYAAGSTSIVMDGFSTAPVAGEWLTIAGDMTPQFVTAYSANTATITPGLKYAVANDAVVTAYTAGAINLSAGYAAGYSKSLTVDGFSIAPCTGQLLTVGTSGTGARYGALATPTTTSLLLDRPLAALCANDAVVGPGPAGDYGFCFHKNALTFVSRPLARPQGNVNCAVVNYNGLSIRVTMGYDMDLQGTQVTVDLLYGVKVLDTDLGCVVLS